MAVGGVVPLVQEPLVRRQRGHLAQRLRGHLGGPAAADQPEVRRRDQGPQVDPDVGRRRVGTPRRGRRRAAGVREVVQGQVGLRVHVVGEERPGVPGDAHQPVLLRGRQAGVRRDPVAGTVAVLARRRGRCRVDACVRRRGDGDQGGSERGRAGDGVPEPGGVLHGTPTFPRRPEPARLRGGVRRPRRAAPRCTRPAGAAGPAWSPRARRPSPGSAPGSGRSRPAR